MSAETAIRTWEDYLRIYRFSLENRDEFWGAVARSYLAWRKPWSSVLKGDGFSGVQWFSGGELNVAENCLDRHLEGGKGEKPALIWVGNEPFEERIFTYRELYREVCRIAFALEAIGIQKGDRVLFYLPNIPELAIGVLACARIGAIHSVVFGGFSGPAIQSRANDCGAKLIVTADGTYRGSKWIELKGKVDEALSLGCPTVERVIVLKRGRQERSSPLNEMELDWEEWAHAGLPEIHRAPAHQATDPLFILYTSGSTGKPKGVMHAMGGYLTYVTYTFKTVFQPQDNDVFWCTADVGWITGHSYLIYGPLAAGVTTVMFEGVPTYPDAGRFWAEVDRYRVSILYTSPTAIRVLAGAGNEFLEKSSRKSLRTFGTVGEPIGSEAWRWAHEIVGARRVSMVDTWWQTETGGIMISPIAGVSASPAGSAGFPLPGIEPVIQSGGGLTIKRSWPGQMTGVYGDPGRFAETYLTHYPGHYFSGDSARLDEEGFYWILGRMDDVIKVSGHRLGTAEIEAACLTCEHVLESAAIGVADEITGEAIWVFAVPKHWSSSFRAASGIEGVYSSDLKKSIQQQVGSLAVPRQIIWVPGIPKTRSGKIMRRLLKKVALKQFEELGDVTTLADPSIMEEIVRTVEGAV